MAGQVDRNGSGDARYVKSNWIVSVGFLAASLCASPLVYLNPAFVGVACAQTSRDDVRAAQQALGGLGFDPGPADGAIGQRTRAAIADFQRTRGLTPTGQLDDRTLQTLG